MRASQANVTDGGSITHYYVPENVTGEAFLRGACPYAKRPVLACRNLSLNALQLVDQFFVLLVAIKYRFCGVLYSCLNITCA